jgi:PrgI family protein
MASYNIPQFLDSGDKILGPLNIRQFGYALVGSLLSFVTYTIIQALAPGLGVYALVPVLPLVAVFGYLSVGKYNGRDSEVYVLKLIIYSLKPREMVYSRVADNSDLDEHLSKITYDNISKEWNSRIAQNTNEEAQFENHTTRVKAEKIRELGLSIDSGQRNALQSVIRNTVANEINQNTLDALLPKKNSQKYTQSLLINKQTSVAPIAEIKNGADANYFDQNKQS